MQYHVMFETENLGQHSRTSEFLCVYTFVASLLHVCMCIYAHVHMYMWMSEPNRGYLTFFTLLFEVGSLTEPEVCGFGKVGRPHLPTTHLSLSVLGLQAHATVPSFWMWVPEITLWSLCLYGKLFTDGVFSQTQSFSAVCLIVCDTLKASTYLGQGYVHLKANW